MTKALIRLELDMDQAILGVNKIKNLFILSNYTLTNQIVIVNFFIAVILFLFLLAFNLYLFSGSKNLNIQNQIIEEKINIITEYLEKNAITRILTFNDSCNRISKEANIDCRKNTFLDKNYEDQLPQLDPTYTQQYIYSNFLNSSLNIKVINDKLMKLADTNDIYGDKNEVIISDIDTSIKLENNQSSGFYNLYKKKYFYYFNLIKSIIDKKKINKLNIIKKKHDNAFLTDTINFNKSSSYIYKNQDNIFKTIFVKTILKDNRVLGVVVIDTFVLFEDRQSATQSILLTNFFIFFISIMFFLSFIFLRSIIAPIKILSYNTTLERNKNVNSLEIINYPNRKDEIGDLSKDIKSMTMDLKKRIKEIEEFASDVSHELKNPLAGLKSSIELLKTKKLNENNNDKLIKNMGTDIERMNILISDISNYSLTQVEISEEAYEEFDLISFLINFKNGISKKHCSLEIKTSEIEVILKVNKNKFIQVIYNLIDNAVSYHAKNSKILIFVEIIEKYCIINFVDQGPGISLDYKDKIFERFYTDRDKNRNSHSGLGLSISKKIIESFDGNINLINSSHLGFKGACFEIKLPLKDL